MSENIILKKNPRIEFQLLDTGFELIDGQTERNTGFYSYDDVQSIDLNNVWFPRLAKWLRLITWIFNGVPYFPDAESYKKSSLIIHFRNTKFGIWLTDTYMAEKAKRIKELLDKKLNKPGNNEEI
ncbi:MAG: hypothetical protein C0597_15680 [Marinilabiliales bacterium]|nr:MAG: hypothetical protein C0597_15680 [Marinilabiliales bacterium]